MSRLVLPADRIDSAARSKVDSHHRDIVEEVDAAVKDQPVVVVGMAQNPFPRKACKLLKAKGIQFEYLEYGSYLSEWRRRNALKMWTGWPTFPMVFVQGTLIGGYDRPMASPLEVAFWSKQLDLLLALGLQTPERLLSGVSRILAGITVFGLVVGVPLVHRGSWSRRHWAPISLLLWILVVFAMMTESTPAPRDFRGDEPAASMILGESVAVTNRGIYIPRIAFSRSLSGNEAVAPQEGMTPVTSGLIDWVIVLAVLGLSIAAMRVVTRRANKIQEATGDRPTTWYVNLGILVVPLAIVFLILGATIVQPYLKGFNFTEGVHLRNSLIALWIALSLYTGAFIAENVRAGILAINKGQTEAAYALGMRPSWTMNLVILPQALRVIIPPLISQFLNLTKNSSLAIAVGYMDVRATLGGITINQTGRELEGMLLMAAFYLVVSLAISSLMNVYNRSTQLKER